MPVMNPGDKEYLKQVFQMQTITVDGEDVTEGVEIGSVMRAIPGPRVVGPEFIRLHTTEGNYNWNAPLDDYDPDTVGDEPANEARWVAI